MHALGLPAERVEAALLESLPAGPIARMLDIGTGTGRLLELLGPRAQSATGIDASRAMLALARARIAGQRALEHCAVRLGDMYRLPMPDGHFDLVVMQMVLHHAEDPAAALAEAARVLAPRGTLVVVGFWRPTPTPRRRAGSPIAGRDSASARCATCWPRPACFPPRRSRSTARLRPASGPRPVA